MSGITDVKCVITQKSLHAFCNKFHIPEEVHPVLPDQNDTMHERPTGKIRLYTRFFDFANFRLPLSTFLVDVLRHFRINISHLSVIGAAKVSHFEILCRVYGIIPTVGLFRCFYENSRKSGWMPFSKRSDNASVSKHVIRDPASAAADFNKQDYATLVAHPSPFRKFPKAFLCLVGLSRHYTLDEETYPLFLLKNGEEMDIFAFIHTPDPTKVKIVEREWNEGEPLLLETTIGRTVPLLPVAPDRAGSELDASVERLFDEGGSGNQTEQGDSACGGKDADIQPVIEAANTVVEDVALVQPKRQRKRKSVIVDAGEASHPPKKLRDDHGTPSGTFVGGKSRSTIQRLLVGAVLKAEVEVAAIPTLPFVTASISTTPEHEGGDHTDSMAGLNLCAIGAPSRFVISLDSSHHSGTNVAEAEVDSLVKSSVLIMTTVTTITSTVDPASVAKEKLVKPSRFCADSSSAGGIDPTTGVFSNLTGSDFLVGVIRTVIDPDTYLQKIDVPQWSVTNGSRLDDGHVCRKMVDEFAPPKFFVFVRGMEYDQQFIEFNVGVARQMSLSAEVRMHDEYNVKEKRRLKSVVERHVELLKSLRDETNALKEHNAILEKERNALDVKVHELEISSFGLQEKVTVYENCMDQLEKIQDDRMKVFSDKFNKLWLLTHGMELAIVKCLNLPEYLSALGAAISKAIEKGMQDGLSAGIVHGKEGRVLTDVAAHNPSVEVDYTSALQQLRNVNFSLLAKLKSNKDASVEIVMDILRLEGPLAKKLGLNELQPDIDQLMVPIHRLSDKVVLGATALSLALDVSSFRVRKIRENIANERSTLRDVFVPLAEPFSAAVLTGTKVTSDIVPATANTTAALSTTFTSTSSIAPISVDDYEVVGADDQAVTDGNVASFPNVDDAKLNIL
ncbi:hypothetical protein Tco_0326723 [Tanacetum coccineum]